VGEHNEQQEIVEQEDDAGLENNDINLTSEQLLKYKFSTFNVEDGLKILNSK
jgi:transposase